MEQEQIEQSGGGSFDPSTDAVVLCATESEAACRGCWYAADSLARDGADRQTLTERTQAGLEVARKLGGLVDINVKDGNRHHIRQ